MLVKKKKARCFLKESSRALDGTELLTFGWIQQTPQSTHVGKIHRKFPGSEELDLDTTCKITVL